MAVESEIDRIAMADRDNDVAELIELHNHLDQAARALRCAWRIMKRMGMEASAQEAAATTLDTEDAARLVQTKIKEMDDSQGSTHEA